MFQIWLGKNPSDLSLWSSSSLRSWLRLQRRPVQALAVTLLAGVAVELLVGVADPGEAIIAITIIMSICARCPSANAKLQVQLVALRQPV